MPCNCRPPGTTFASTLSNFDKSFDGLDCVGVTFVTCCSLLQVVSGTTLVVTDGGNKYDFQLGGTLGASYSVTSDGAGVGMLINDPPRSEAAFGQAFSLLTNPNFVGSSGVYGASDSAQSSRRLDLAAAHWDGSVGHGPGPS